MLQFDVSPDRFVRYSALPRLHRVAIIIQSFLPKFRISTKQLLHRYVLQNWCYPTRMYTIRHYSHRVNLQLLLNNCAKHFLTTFFYRTVQDQFPILGIANCMLHWLDFTRTLHPHNPIGLRQILAFLLLADWWGYSTKLFMTLHSNTAGLG